VNADGDYAERAIAVVRATNHPLITVGIKGETIRLVSNETTGSRRAS
jgi:hypothetical protein